MSERRGWRRGIGFGMAALLLGLLFWARLIVVSDLPRMAIAEPEAAPAPAPPSDNDVDAPGDGDRGAEATFDPTEGGSPYPEVDPDFDEK